MVVISQRVCINDFMKTPCKFTLPRSLFQEIKSRSSLYSLSASGLIEVAIEHLREAKDPKSVVLAQEDDTYDMVGACYAMNEVDFDFIKTICEETGVKKRIVIMASVALFTKNFPTPSA